MALTDEQIIKCLYVEREARKAAGDRHQSVSAQGLVQAGYAAGLSAQPESKPAMLTHQWCPDCDGCGWVEGGKTMGSSCKKCSGSGRVPL